jgi:hypothetical protein
VEKGYVTLLLLCSPWQPDQKDRVGGLQGRSRAMNPIDWRSTILRWSAVAFTLGAWAGIVLVALKLLA